jgi:hypothetical protein
VPAWLTERRVDDRVFDHDLAHSNLPPSVAPLPSRDCAPSRLTTFAIADRRDCAPSRLCRAATVSPREPLASPLTLRDSLAPRLFSPATVSLASILSPQGTENVRDEAARPSSWGEPPRLIISSLFSSHACRLGSCPSRGHSATEVSVRQTPCCASPAPHCAAVANIRRSAESDSMPDSRCGARQSALRRPPRALRQL